MEKKTIGAFIAVLRKAKGMTQQELADILNVSNKTISRWEREECAPDLMLIPVIAELFGVSCDELLKGERIIEYSHAEKTENTKTNEETAKMTSGKVDKQAKLLIKNVLYHYKSNMWIASAISIIGMILLFGISYGFYKPAIGFCVMLISVVVSLVLIVISVSKLNDRLVGNEIFNSVEETLQKQAIRIRYRYAFRAIYINICVVVLGLPILLIRDAYYEKSVITIDSYLNYFLLLLVGAFAVYWCASIYLEKLFLGQTRKLLKLQYVFRIEKEAILLNVLHGIWLMSIFILSFNIQDFRVGGIIMLVIFPFCVVICIVINRAHYRLVVITALRNLGIFISLGYMSSLYGYSYEYNSSGKMMILAKYFDWDRIYIPFIIFLVSLLGYHILKRWLIDSKSFQKNECI